MFDSLYKAFLHELRSISKSYYKISLISVLPIFCFVFISLIFKDGVVHNLPISVIDNDKTQISRKLLSNLESSPTIHIANTQTSLRNSLSLLKRGDIYGIVIIPKDLAKDTLLQKNPKITAMLNSQYILIGKILTSALNNIIQASSSKIQYIHSLHKSKNKYITMNSIYPIKVQITPFFNTHQNYFLFLVTALIPAIWQIFIIIATLVSFGSMFKNKTQNQFFNDSYIELKIIGKLLPYTIAYFLLGVFYIFYIYGTLGWKFEGSLGVTIFAIFLTTVAYQAVSLFLFSVSFNYARSLSLGAVYSAPAFAFLGVTFPVINMDNFAIFWRNLLPISHYIDIQISQANYGAPITIEVNKLIYIAIFWLLFLPTFFLFRKRLKK